MRRPVLIAVLLAILAIGAGQASAKFVQFRTPSTNIGCVGDTGPRDNWIRCDIRRRNWSPPPAPRSCELDWGQGVQLGRRGRASFICAGDTALNFGPKLAYGTARRIGVIVCRSRTTGLTCVNRHGHGFTMSRQALRRF